MSLDSIADKLNISRESATKYSEDVPLSEADRYDIRANSLRKYEYDVSVFTNENANSYYLLGAFMTDGHIRHDEHEHVYCSVITSKDRDWLETMSELVCPDKPIYDSKESEAYSLVLSHKHIAEWFISKGCTPHKSLTIQFPLVPPAYLRDFIRGCFDGDGCLCIYTAKARKTRQVYSYISSASEPFIQSFAQHLASVDISTTISRSKLCDSVINGRKLTAKNHLYRLHLSKLNTLKLCQFIYYDDCLCLSRKQEKAREIIAMCH